jgi:YHS domain-containing protein
MKLYVFLFIAIVVSTFASAQADEASRKRNFNTENYVAMREWDPVSYFTGKPAKGVTQYQFKYKAIIYYFASEENMKEFEKSPAKYEPAYGGFCAYTVAVNGDRVKINPLTYKIVDKKLYLFYNNGSDNRLLKWNQDEKKNKAAADKNWYAKMH